jgi:hypothetical protein
MIFGRPSANFSICLSSYIKLESLIILIRLIGNCTVFSITQLGHSPTLLSIHDIMVLEM